MCGRYKLSRRKQLVEEYFDSASSEDDWTPRYNIAPTQPVPAISQNSKEPIREFRLTATGVKVGPPLTEFQGILTGVPTYAGGTSPLLLAREPRK